MAMLKEIKVEMGITIEVNGTYIKPVCSVVVACDENDTLEKRKQIWESAWKTVDTQILNKIQEYKNK